MKNSIGSFSRMKSTNINLILNKIREHGSVSRVQIAKETGLTAATVTNLTSELLEADIIVEADIGCSTGGRKPIMLKFNTVDYGICSAYIAPNKVEFAVADFEANIIYYSSKPINGDKSVTESVDFIVSQYEKYSKSSNRIIAGLGLGLHGIVDTEKGVSVFAPNLDWRDVPVGEMLAERLGIPVFADNDVRLMTIGEMWYGVAKNVSDLVFMYIGNGIGGAIVINGNLYNGFKNGSGEIGHCTIDAEGELCSCGNRGCVQTKANRDAMKKAMREYLRKEASILNENSGCSDIMKACLVNNDSVATKVVKNEAVYLGITVNNLINMFNPKMVVVNSDIDGFDKAVMPLLEDEAQKRKMRFFESNSEIRYSHLGEMAVLKGGIAMVLKKICESTLIVKGKN